jgi:prephenate dehydrogenase
MDDPDFFSSAPLDERVVAILGLGLMGGSLALALHGKCKTLLGVDPDPQVVEMAIDRRVVDHASVSSRDLLPQADLVILAAPVGAILSLLRSLPDQHPGPAVVLDLGSTKRQIVGAMQALPPRFDPVGGHPMAGKEVASLANADADLFQHAPFALVPLERSTPAARLLAEQLACSVGARPLWIDAETHDRWVAATSHLPYLLANALAAATPLEARPLVGPGMRSATRLAPTSLTMMVDILSTNRENVLAGLQRFRHALDAVEHSLLSGDLEALRDQLAQGAASYAALIAPEGG